MSSWSEKQTGWDHHGWDGHHKGFFFAPPLFLIGGLLLLLVIFSSGLWVPLLVIGALFYFFSPRSHAWRHEGRKWAKEWGQRWNSEEWKQRWNSDEWKQRWNAEGWGKGWGCGVESRVASEEKPKRDPAEAAYREPSKRKNDGNEYV